MCQAYEGERAAVVAGEQFDTRKGFAAAGNGEPETANPHPASWGGFKDWRHGWGCWQARILPWTVEKIVRERLNDDFTRIYAVKDAFRENGTLPDWLLADLNISGVWHDITC